MTTPTITGPPRAPFSSDAPRRRTRLAVGYLAILGTLPYVILKIAWVSGSYVGFADESLADDRTLAAFNALTLGMDLVAVLVILALTHTWGRRVPAWIVLLPAWVGTGLLVPVVLVAPLAAVSSLWTEPDPGGATTLEPWVQPMVYGSFTAQGIGIAVAFLLYARDRWPAVFTVRAGTRSPGVTQPVYVFGAWLAGVLAVLPISVPLLWALGSDVGMPADLVPREAPQYLVYGVDALLCLLAVLGLAALVHQARSGRPLWHAVLATWVGAGVMWAWGAWGMVVTVAAVSAGTEPAVSGLLPWVHLAQVVAGLLVAMIGFLVMTEAIEDTA
jgi:hypothetical protein